MSKNNTNITVMELDEVLAWEMSGINFSYEDAWTVAIALYRTTQDYAEKFAEIESYEFTEGFYHTVSQRYKENIFPEVTYD